MRICILSLVLIALVSSTLSSEQYATTSDGRTVVLEPDGSWRYRSAAEGVADLSAAALAEMAGKSLSRKDHESAGEYARRAAAKAEEVAGKAYFVLGMSRWASGDLEEATFAFESCVKKGTHRYAATCAKTLERIEKSRLNFYDPPLDWGDPLREIIAEEPGE